MRVLSLDGGGGRGLVTLQVLKELEVALGGPISKHVDLIAGTSTGGILAAALAAGTPADKLETLYLAGIPKIFHNGWKRRALTLWGLRDQKYGDDGLRNLLREVLGDATLGDAATRVLIPAWDLAGGHLKWHRSWDPEDAKLLLRDVAHRTAAAPTYFEPYQGYCDGGVVANSPAYRAWLEAWELEGVGGHSLLSLGTGETREPVDSKVARGWGFGGWAKPLVGILVGGQGVEGDDVLRSVYDAPDGGDGAGGCYVRVQPDLTAEPSEVKAMDARDPAVLREWVCAGKSATLKQWPQIFAIAQEWRS
jgi:patatin-like phospholipase/acyl hydrolase